MSVFHKWRPIEDLPEDPRGLTDGELDSLLLVWQDHRQELEKQGRLKPFLDKLSRSWAIETGIIEGAYTLTPGVTLTLIEKGISPEQISSDPTVRDPVLVAAMLEDHQATLEGLFSFVKGERDLSTSYVKELHASLLGHVETYVARTSSGVLFDKKLVKGAYKTEPNSPIRKDGQIHEYAPPEHVDSEMDRLIEMHRSHILGGIPVEVSAAWLHHCFTQIHPFQDGNGRVARAMASLVFLKAGWFPLSVHRDQRDAYIDALERADRGKLKPLVQLFVRIQRSDLLQAVDASIQTNQPASLDAAIAAVRDRFVAAGQLAHPTWRQAIDNAHTVVQDGHRILTQTSGKLSSSIGKLKNNFFSGAVNAFRHWEPLVSATRLLGLPVDTNEVMNGQELMLSNNRSFGVWFACIGKGPQFHGFVYVLAGISRPGRVEILGPELLLNYSEPAEAALARFAPWLEQRLIEAITKWSNESAPPAEPTH